MKTKRIVAVAAMVLFSVAVFFGTAGNLVAEENVLVKEIVKLLEAKVGEETIKAFIAGKRTADEKISADDIVALKKAGASDTLIMALLKQDGMPTEPDGFPFDLDREHIVDKPIVHGMMAIYPIRRKAPSEIGVYMTLDEASVQNAILIQEKEGGLVPVVIVRNNGRIPIYITAGEIIIGGKQDRMVAYDVIIYPEKELTIEVRCVEHGRWQGGSMNFRSAGAMGGRKTKAAVQLYDQSRVWKEVAEQNKDAKVSPSTGTYVATITNEDVQKSCAEYSKAILPALEGRDVVGFIVAINGKIQAIEIFGSPGIFSKIKGKILKSYVLDIIGLSIANASVPGKNEILSFYNELMKQRQEEMKSYEKNINKKRENSEASQMECLDSENRTIRNSFIKK